MRSPIVTNLLRGHVTASLQGLALVEPERQATVLAMLRQRGPTDDADRVNPNGGAITHGHPLSADGPQLTLMAVIKPAAGVTAAVLPSPWVWVSHGVAVLLDNV